MYELNESTAGSLSPFTIQSSLQSSKGLSLGLRVSDWAPKARLGDNNEDQIHSHTGFTLHHIILFRGYEIDAWFAPPAPSLIL